LSKEEEDEEEIYLQECDDKLSILLTTLYRHWTEWTDADGQNWRDNNSALLLFICANEKKNRREYFVYFTFF